MFNLHVYHAGAVGVLLCHGRGGPLAKQYVCLSGRGRCWGHCHLGEFVHIVTSTVHGIDNGYTLFVHVFPKHGQIVSEIGLTNLQASCFSSTLCVLFFACSKMYQKLLVDELKLFDFLELLSYSITTTSCLCTFPSKWWGHACSSCCHGYGNQCYM